MPRHVELFHAPVMSRTSRMATQRDVRSWPFRAAGRVYVTSFDGPHHEEMRAHLAVDARAAW
ncbi:MAG TPA: hypothetical protein VGB85_13940 [Nannocystis sp.]|jgi:hypothetical protein